MYRAVIFDFDYTLGDSSQGIVLSVNHALAQMGHPEKGAQEIHRTIGLSLHETFKQLTGSDDPSHAAQFTRLFHEKAESVMVASTQLYPHTPALLRDLKARGCQTAIVTTKLRRRINQILDQFSSSALIDLVVGAEDVRAEKPSPEGLLWAINHLGISPEQALYVGDSLVDAQAAQRAGVCFAAMLTGKTSREAFASYSPVIIAQDLTELHRFLGGIEQ